MGAPAAAERVRCTSAAPAADDGVHGSADVPPADDDPPAHRGAAGVGPVEDGDPGARPPAASGTGRWATHAVSAAAMPAAVGATPARVMSSASSREPDRAPGARPPRRRRPSRRPSARPCRPRSRAWPASGAAVSATSRRSATQIRVGRSRCIRPAGPPNRASVMRPPVAEQARGPRGQPGHGEHARQLGGAEPDREHVLVPAGRQPHARGRGRPHGVAGGGHVQFGEHVLEVDRGDRVHEAPGRARRARPSASWARSAAVASAARGPRRPARRPAGRSPARRPCPRRTTRTPAGPVPTSFPRGVTRWISAERRPDRPIAARFPAHSQTPRA